MRKDKEMIENYQELKKNGGNMGLMEGIIQNKTSIGLSLIVILIVGTLYFGVEGLGASAMEGGTRNSSTEAYKGILLKTAFTEKGEMKVFALAKNNTLSMYSAIEGNSIPEQDSIVIGEMEADMMKDENLFSKIGDKINGLFGIDTSIEGVLAKSNAPLDYLHFAQATQFGKINGDSNLIYIKIVDEKNAKVFYYSDSNILPGNSKLKEGKMEDYKEHEIVGITYYPMIIGNEEAAMMIKEGLFSKVGDTFERFGKNFIVIGILEKNNSMLDMVHIVPLTAGELE
jgi:hypothetical protein